MPTGLGLHYARNQRTDLELKIRQSTKWRFVQDFDDQETENTKQQLRSDLVPSPVEKPSIEILRERYAQSPESLYLTSEYRSPSHLRPRNIYLSSHITVGHSNLPCVMNM